MSLAEPAMTAHMSPCGRYQAAGDPVRTRAAGIAIGTMAALLCVVATLGYALVFRLLLIEGRSFIDNFFPFWSWSRFIHEADVPARIYQFPVLDAFQRSIDARSYERLPFAYPPSFMLVIWPLGFLTRLAAYGVFMGGSLALYLAACWHRPWGRLTTGLGLIVPSTVLAIFTAQNSLLIAALMIGGCRLTGKRPILAGMLFGLMSFKPQFGLLLPVALVSAREWRSFAAAAATVLTGVLASGAVFGWATWAALPMALVHLARFEAPVARANELSPTVSATLRLLGASPVVVQGGQLVAATLVGGIVFLCFRRGFTPRTTAALLVGTFFTTPYAFYYDLPIVSYAVLLICIDAQRGRMSLRVWEIVVIAVVILMPYLWFFTPFGLPYGGIGLAILFGLIVRRVFFADRHLAPGVTLGAVTG